MKITEDARKYAAERGLTDAGAVEAGLHQKAMEFEKQGSQLYAKS